MKLEANFNLSGDHKRILESFFQSPVEITILSSRELCTHLYRFFFSCTNYQAEKTHLYHLDLVAMKT